MNISKYLIQRISFFSRLNISTISSIFILAISGFLSGCNLGMDQDSQEWKQVDIPGAVENILGVSIEDDICYMPDEINFYILLKDKTVYQCPVGNSCVESSAPESLNTSKSGGLGTFCFFELDTSQGDAPNPLPEGHGAKKGSLHVAGGESKVVDVFYVIFEDGTLWWTK
jgi:hypothetical protein